MPGLPDTAVIVLLALLLFGPKKLPVLARQLGKLMADFRRASNEFRAQMEEELRISEQADRQKQVAAIEAAAPPSPAIDVHSSPDTHVTSEPQSGYMPDDQPPEATPEVTSDSPAEATPAAVDPAPLPIATSGELSIMPPATGLPIANTTTQAQESELETETLHG
jgi:sec-independent protein translocase protein TatB